MAADGSIRLRSRGCSRPIEIPMVPTFAAADAEQAVAHASALFAQGATVVLKILSRDIVHKSDVGGVVLNLTNADAVRAATADILARARSLRPEARISGVIVQAMVVRPKARELILGLADDPTFGTVVVFGRGGTAVEIINDKALALPPLDLQLARDLIERTRVSRLLRAYRDVPAVKQDAVAMVLVKLAQMAADIPEIRELDINPLLADETGVLAVDARVAVGQAERESSPAQVPPISRCGPIRRNGSGIFEVKDGWRVFVRPIRPEDEPLIHELLRHVTQRGSAAAVLRADEGIHPRVHRAADPARLCARDGVCRVRRGHQRTGRRGPDPFRIRSTRPANTRSCCAPISRAGGSAGR